MRASGIPKRRGRALIAPRQHGESPLLISLIVCTRNRAQALARCLSAIASADYAGVEAELVIVDNGSTDETTDVIGTFCRAAPLPVRQALAPVTGLSNARNAGVREARGDILAFTDDDCYVAADYFTALRDAYRDAPFDYSGGRILLFDPTDAPYACNDSHRLRCIAPGSFIHAGMIQGANMAMTRRLVDTVGAFDPTLGAGTRFRCEDVDYIARASAAGYMGAHLPQVAVFHHHERKAGPGLERLKRENDYARGAYYAKCLLGGDVAVLYHWIRISWRVRPEHHLGVELRGGLDYVRSERKRRRKGDVQ
jgi:glycosyltransferase involved in cell wall biosynthesis